MGPVRRLGWVLSATLIAVAASVTSAPSSAAEPAPTFGEFLRLERQLPGLIATELMPAPAGSPDRAIDTLPARDLMVAGVGTTFAVIETDTYRVVHEQPMGGDIVALDVSDDASTLVVSLGGDTIVFFETLLWTETDRLDLPTNAAPADDVTFAPASTDTVLTVTDDRFSVIDGDTVAVPSYVWADEQPAALAGVIWGDDADTVHVLALDGFHEVDVSTATPSVSRSLAVPKGPPATPRRALHRAGDEVVSDWGFAIDPVAWEIAADWPATTWRFGGRGDDTTIVTDGPNVDVRVAGVTTHTFEMPSTFAPVWMLPLGSAAFLYVEADGHLRVGDAAFLGSPYGEYTALTPARVFDTRIPIGQPEVLALGAEEVRTVQIGGVGGVPADGATAVVVNVTGVNASEPTFVSVFPADAGVPTVSTLNFDLETARPGAAVANLATVQLGEQGEIDVYNGKGTIDVILDVMGFYSAADGPDGARFIALDQPRRIADTRTGLGTLGARLGTGDTRALDVGAELAAVTDLEAAVLQITAIRPTAGGFLTAYPGDVSRPTVSNINLLPGRTSPNMAIVRVPSDGIVEIFQRTGGVDLAVDLVGYFERRHGPFTDQAGRVLPLEPWRLVDTRLDSPFDPPGALPPGSELVVPTIGSTTQSAAAGTFGEGWTLVMNLTAVVPTEAGFLAVVPTNTTNPKPVKPTTSNVNFTTGQVRPTHAFVTAGPVWSVFNSHGLTHVLVDIYGFITPAEPATSVPDFSS